MPSVDVNGVTIEYRVRGVGEPVLFVMGLGGQLIDWPEDFLDLFIDRGYSVITFDNRDIGLSTKTDHESPSSAQLARAVARRKPISWDGYTMVDMGNDAAGLLDALDVGPAHVIGISMGGMIAQELTINNHSRVRSLCSIMSNTGDRKNGRMAASLLPKLAGQARPNRDTAVDDAVDWFEIISGPHFDRAIFRPYAEARVKRDYDPAGVARQTGAIMATRDRTALLGTVTAPTLVIHGLLDKLVKPSGGMATARAVPHSRLLGFGDMAHDLPRPRWPEMADAIIANFHR